MQVQGQGAVEEEPLSLLHVFELSSEDRARGPDDQNCGLGQLTVGEHYEIHGHESPVILKFLLERLQKEGRFKTWEFEEVEKCQGSCMAFPKVLDSASSALNEGLLPGLFPSSEVGGVRRSFPVPSLRARSTSTSEMPSPNFQEYQWPDGTTFSRRLPRAYSQTTSLVSS